MESPVRSTIKYPSQGTPRRPGTLYCCSARRHKQQQETYPDPKPSAGKRPCHSPGALLKHNPGGVKLSTDDYFTHNGEYQFDPTALGEAHEWNHKRAKEAFERGANPIIIDNTNLQAWEMRPYVVQALKHGYKVLFREPDTWWKNKPRELERRTAHNVPVETIRRMLNGYERFVTVQSIMGSQMPEFKQRILLENRSAKQASSETPSIGNSSEAGALEDGAHKSTESLNFQPTGRVEENPEISDRDDDMDLGDLDSELEAQLQLNHPIGDQRIPDCIVESVMNEDHCGEEIPVAFAESIRQRVRREKPSRGSGFDRSEPLDLVKDTHQSDSGAKEKEKTKDEEADGVEKEMPKMLDFVGDWPSEGSLEQRQVRRRERHKEGNGKEDEGGAPVETGSSCSSSLSSGEELEKEEESGSEFKKSHGSRSNTDSYKARESRIDNWEGNKTRDEVNVTVETNVCHNRVGSHNVEAEVTTEPASGDTDVSMNDCAENDRETRAEADGSHISENCPASSPSTTAQCINSEQSSTDTDVNSNCNTDLKAEPQDFALLWLLNRQDSPDDAIVAACTLPPDIVVLSGDSSRFVSEMSSAVSAAVAVHPSGHREVPYRVVHEKGTQVEETELGAAQDQLESLRILSRHFKLVSFDTLEDLYDKCHQDLEWTTNLLLDSGERFFRDEDGEKEEEEEEDGAESEDDQNTSGPCGALEKAVESTLGPSELNEHEPEVWLNRETSACEEGTQLSPTVSESDESSNNTDVQSSGGAAVPIRNKEHPEAIPQLEKCPQTDFPQALKEGERRGNTEYKVTPEAFLQGGAWGGSLDDGVIIEESRVEEEIASMDEVHRVLQAEFDEAGEIGKAERSGEGRKEERTCSTDDYVVQMDLNLAKLLHQKWKETIQEKQRQATLSFHLLPERSLHWGESQVAKTGSRERGQAARFLISADGYASPEGQPEASRQMPHMDHWNVPHSHVSLRDIIEEEQALQKNVEKTRQSRADLDRRDGATLLKENQLYALFPTIDRHFLQDIFRDHNYNLKQTELFLHSLLGEEPVKTVVAPETPRTDHHRTASKEREKRQKPLESIIPDYQDTEDPEYEDFRAEASLQRMRQLESFAKAAEAYKQGRKEVASFYAQQGHLHGKRMREANHRAAVQIFERVNSSLLPRNILDLHGLHVDEALEHLARVLQKKTTDCEQGLCRPQLSVITGRGNHSQGGVARIRPAVIDYLTNKHYSSAPAQQSLYEARFNDQVKNLTSRPCILLIGLETYLFERNDGPRDHQREGPEPDRTSETKAEVR
ncbi:hypothetical protein L3Q82_005381 [Scortum barcoo]|uniref:Uncharacterized protein n=1 Tax=Scortum barcoo TaxID=214431 RepID=A0ACB8V9U9_9TELE|nr:hypothetical protein L3Q82_005381 [Scortum barcoo]